MAKCKVCSTSYHTCPSCGLEDWEYEFCCKNCRDEALDFGRIEAIISKMVNSLTEEEAKFYFESTGYDFVNGMLDTALNLKFL